MSHVLAYLLFALAAAVLIVVLMALRQPKAFRAARTMRIAAPQGRLHGLINDLKKMNTWNPYALRDTSGSGEYAGAEAGPGATFRFNGAKSGTGSISIVESTPSQVVLRLLMSKPIACDNRVEFSLKPAGEATDVTWAMSGDASFPARVFGVFVDCQKMCARDFDEGLTNLKTLAETA
jgi:hypothetical protein